MRIYPKAFNSVIIGITNSSIRSVLLYGPDKGMIEHFILQIKESLKLALSKIEYNTAISLHQLVNTLNLFHEREIIVVKNFGTVLTKQNKELFDADFHNFIIIVADELGPNSSLRQFFEKHKSLVSIACYPDSISDIKSIILSTLKQKGKLITQDALSYIASNVNTDRQVLYSELDKICTYVHDSSTISLPMLGSLLVLSPLPSIDRICIYFAHQNSVGYFNELENFFNVNNNPMLLIRSLIRYYTNIFVVKHKMSCGISLDEAIKSLIPPIFFMYLDEFKVLVNKLQIDVIINIIQQLINTEIDLKSSTQNSKIAFEHIFYKHSEL